MKPARKLLTDIKMRIYGFCALFCFIGLNPIMALAESDAGPSDPSSVQVESFSDTWTGRPIPAEESTFIEIIKKAQKSFAAGGDKDTIRTQRKSSLSTWGQTKFKGWIGLLSHMPDDGGDGNISIRITINQDITLETPFEIAPSSNIFKTANPLAYGTIVEISGEFVPDAKDFFKETSLTSHGGLEAPGWLVRIDSFKALD